MLTPSLLLIFIGIVLCFALKRKGLDFAKPLGIALTAIGVVVSIVMLFGSARPRHPARLLRLDEAVGDRFGRAVAEHAPTSGSVLVLQHPALLRTEDPSAGAQVDGIRNHLPAEKFALTVSGLTAGNYTAVEGPGTNAPTSRIAAFIQSETARLENCVAVISFLPVLQHLSSRELAHLPPLYTYEEIKNDRIHEWILQGAVGGLILPKSTTHNLKQAAADSLDELFDRHFVFKTE